MTRMLDKIKHNRELFLSGKLRCIPFRNAPRLTSYFPGIIKGMLDCISSNSSVGKTSIAKQLYVLNAIDFAIENNLDLKILYFALEESVEQFEYTIYSALAFRLAGVRLNIREFENFTEAISDENLAILAKHNIDEVFEQYMSYIQVYDYKYYSFGIYDTVREFAFSRGKIFMDGKPATDPKHWNSYVPDNEDEFIIVIVDHVSELYPDENEKTLDAAIENMTRYMRNYMAKRFNYNVLSIHQQMAAKEDLQHKKEDFTRVSLQGLGDNKKVGRRYMNVLGINDPYRYGYSIYPNQNGYNLDILESYFRSINIVKQRYGPKDKEIGCFFDGKTGYIRELPEAKDTQNMIRVYEKVQEYDSQL